MTYAEEGAKSEEKVLEVKFFKQKPQGVKIIYLLPTP